MGEEAPWSLHRPFNASHGPMVLSDSTVIHNGNISQEEGIHELTDVVIGKIIKFKVAVMKPSHWKYSFCVWNVLNLTYEHLAIQNNFLGLCPLDPQQAGREGEAEGRKGVRKGEGRKAEGRGREERGEWKEGGMGLGIPIFVPSLHQCLHLINCLVIWSESNIFASAGMLAI